MSDIENKDKNENKIDNKDIKDNLKFNIFFKNKIKQYINEIKKAIKNPSKNVFALPAMIVDIAAILGYTNALIGDKSILIAVIGGLFTVFAFLNYKQSKLKKGITITSMVLFIIAVLPFINNTSSEIARNLNKPTPSATTSPTPRYNTTPSTPTPSPSETTEPITKVEKPIGNTYSLKGLDIKINKTYSSDSLSHRYGDNTVAKKGAKFFVVEVTLTNTTKSKNSFFRPDDYFELLSCKTISTDCLEYKDYEDSIGATENYATGKELSPQIGVDADLIYEVPNNSKDHWLYFFSDSDDKKYALKL
ncbi:MAG: DUF4352 domain-containing protein [Bifidobacteriaceae bacterium]|jgi:hypothetical protein|nr:DUF4352 domain-containing protein [Bifidobacteriaceae bacterium]